VVIDVRKINLALLGKWIWRLKSEKRSLWKDILDSKYGGWRGLKSQVHNCRESMWWRDIWKVWNLEEWGNGFDDRGVEPSGVQVLKNPNPLKDVEASAMLDVVVLV